MRVLALIAWVASAIVTYLAIAYVIVIAWVFPIRTYSGLSELSADEWIVAGGLLLVALALFVIGLGCFRRRRRRTAPSMT